MSVTRPAIAVLAALLPLAAALGAAPEQRLVDTVGTLELDRELDARGNLGGIAVDRLGFLYVANFRDAVWRIDPEGHVSEVSRSMYGASGMAFDRRGRLYQANFLGDTIVRIDRSGAHETFADEGLAGPVGIAIDDDGVLFVCNCRGNTISRIDPDGAVTTFAESDLFACPNGITFGGDDTLYVTNFNNHRILSIDPDGEVAEFATVPGGAGNAHLAYANGVFYVTKIVSNRVVKLTPDGSVLPVAGSGAPGHDDGPGPEATLFRPNGIAVAPGGRRLYVNTMRGAWSQPQPSVVTVRTIDLVTITSVIEDALEAGSLDDALAAYHAYRADPVRGQENTSAEVVALAYRFLSARDVPTAEALFRLNAESYPDDPTAQYQLGELFRYTGRAGDAVAQYRRALELDPEHRLAASRLAQLEGD